MTIGADCNLQAAYVELLSPANSHVPPDEGRGRILEWSPGLDFDMHGVYTGPVEADVIAGINDTFKGDQSAANFQLVLPGGGVGFWRVATVGQGTRIEGDTLEITMVRNIRVM